MGFDAGGVVLDTGGVMVDAGRVGLDTGGVELDTGGVGLDVGGVVLDARRVGLETGDVGLGAGAVGLSAVGILDCGAGVLGDDSTSTPAGGDANGDFGEVDRVWPGAWLRRGEAGGEEAAMSAKRGCRPAASIPGNRATGDLGESKDLSPPPPDLEERCLTAAAAVDKGTSSPKGNSV